MRVRPTVNDSATPTEVSVIDADKVGGFIPSQTPAANQIPVKDGSGNLVLLSGNVGIGVSPTNAKLEVVSTTGEVLRVDAASGAYRIVANQDEVWLGSKVLVNTDTEVIPGAKLQVNGTVGITAPLVLKASGGNQWEWYPGVNNIGLFNRTTGIYSITVGNNGNAYFVGDVSAATFTDRTPFFEGDALTAVRGIKGKNGEIDHKSLPSFAYVKKRKKDRDGNEKEEEGRDIGAMLSVLTVAIQQLLDRVEKLEAKSVPKG